MPMDDDVDTGAEDFIDDETDVAGAPDEIRKTPGREDLVIAKRWVVVVKDLPSLLKEICVRRKIPWYQKMAISHENRGLYSLHFKSLQKSVVIKY